ncbi:hypothetical protein [Pararhizobium sp. O133]|uniref:hypothetical protein n=1 Tax=Pararhizobium sp. O133 TaxID=3449278 RepID=UPI003F6879E3
MEKLQEAATPRREIVMFAKKHRIEVEDAEKILEEFGEDKKKADKAARRIAA